MQDSISVVFPVYNEEKIVVRTISITIGVLEKVTEDYEIVIVNDASTDNTQKIIEEISQKNDRVKIINHERNRKLGGSLKTGFGFAKKDLILYSDADLPFDMRELDKALKILKTKNADLLSAYRFDRDKEGSLRGMYSFIYNILIRFLFGFKIRDVNFSFKLFKREILDTVHLVSVGSFIMAELLIKSYRKGFKIVQIGTKYSARTKGHSRLLSLGVIVKILQEAFAFRLGLLTDRDGKEC